jgi:hypothetical protein
MEDEGQNVYEILDREMKKSGEGSGREDWEDVHPFFGHLAVLKERYRTKGPHESGFSPVHRYNPFVHVKHFQSGIERLELRVYVLKMIIQVKEPRIYFRLVIGNHHST